MDRQILRLAWPNILSNITVPLLGLVDLAIMGHLDSPVYVGAIALGGIIFNFLYLGFGFLRMGTVGFTSQALGSRQLDEALAYLARGLIVALIFGLLFITIQIPIAKISFYFLHGSVDVEKNALQYFYIRIWAAPAALSLFVMNGWFLGMQNARFPMMITIVVNLVNIVLNFFFVYVLKMKADGVALATTLAQYSGLILSILLFWATYKRLFLHWKPILLRNVAKFKGFLHVNADIFIRTISIIFALAFFTSVSAKENDQTLAANQILLQFFFIFSYFADGFAHAAEALTGKFLGSKNVSSFRLSVRRLFRFGLFVTVGFVLVFGLGGNGLFSLMTNQPELISFARPYIFWTTLIPVTACAAFIWDGIYIGATASKIMRNTMLFATFIIYIPAYYLLHLRLGNHGLWLALNIYLLSRSLLMTFYYKSRILNLFN